MHNLGRVISSCTRNAVLGGSGVVISGVISPLVWVISTVTLLIMLLLTTINYP